MDHSKLSCIHRMSWRLLAKPSMKAFDFAFAHPSVVTSSAELSLPEPRAISLQVDPKCAHCTVQLLLQSSE
eukprot:1035143-Pleurochrysis_carterae.AAC.3